MAMRGQRWHRRQARRGSQRRPHILLVEPRDDLDFEPLASTSPDDKPAHAIPPRRSGLCVGPMSCPPIACKAERRAEHSPIAEPRRASTRVPRSADRIGRPLRFETASREAEATNTPPSPAVPPPLPWETSAGQTPGKPRPDRPIGPFGTIEGRSEARPGSLRRSFGRCCKCGSSP